MNVIRWMSVVLIVYFLLVVLFLSFGFGKLMNLMGGETAWQLFKDVIEISSWLATIIGIFIAVKTYRDSVSEKELREIGDAFSEFKANSENSEFFCLNWNKTSVAYLIYLTRLGALSIADRKEFDESCAAYIRDLLKQFTFKSFFGKELLDERADVINKLAIGLSYPLVDIKLGYYLYMRGLANKFPDSNLWLVKDPFLMQQFFSKIICIGQPILNGSAYKPKQHYWEPDSLSGLDLLIGEVPASIIRLIYSPSAYKNTLFDSIERLCIE